MQYTKFEIARLLGARALQLSMGAPLLVKLSKEELARLRYDTLSIARRELQAGVIPLSVVRPAPRVPQKGQDVGEHLEGLED